MALRGFSLLPSIVTHLLPLSHRVVSIPKLDLVAAGLCEDQEMCAMEQFLLVSGAVTTVDDSPTEHAEFRISCAKHVIKIHAY